MIFLLILLIVITIIVLAVSYFRERRGLKQKTVETIGDKLWHEIDKEREESIERGKKFRRELLEADDRIKKSGY